MQTFHLLPDPFTAVIVSVFLDVLVPYPLRCGARGSLLDGSMLRNGVRCRSGHREVFGRPVSLGVEADSSEVISIITTARVVALPAFLLAF